MPQTHDMKRLTPLALVMLVFSTTVPAAAQTPAATVEDGDDTIVLQSFVDGALWVPGTFGTGTIPATGAGTRLMWYPAKAAFRAGRIDGGQWDDGNVGKHSTAMGNNTEASGPNATAMGNGTTASGGASTAMGLNTTASNFRATAMGNNTEASGPNATAMGDGTTASALQSTAMGKNTTANGQAATAMGLGTTASDVATTAMGRNTTASGAVATAMGRDTEASANRATAMGDRTTASARQSTAMGKNTTAASNNSLSLGQWNDANTSADNTRLVVGNGTGDSNRSDALVLKRGGNMTIAGTLTENSDRRLKEGIESLGAGVLGKLGELRPVRFHFKNERTHPSGSQLGLIAQDVRNEFPELVSEGSGGYLSVSYSKLTAVLLKGLQEQQGRIEAQDEKIEALEQRLSALEEERSGALAAGGPWTVLLMGALALGGIALWRRFGEGTGLGAAGFLGIAALLVSVPTAQAQTPAATVKDDSDTVVLQSFVDGALLAPGTFGTGTIPTSGSGTRMMWYPAKAALRAGQVDGTQWNDENVGENSVAFGEDTQASGEYATAMGENTTASGNIATAIGFETFASGTVSMAMGFQTTASGNGGTAMGERTLASGQSSTSMGQFTTAANDNSLSVGQCNSANTSADNTLFVVGAGEAGGLSCDDRSDALVLKKSGNLTIAGSVTSENGGFVLPDGTTLDESGDLGGLPTNGNGAFDLSNEDGHVASGTFGSGAIPTSGAGTRMMWYPAKAAFRAGRVNGTGWDPSNVGNYSMALGRNLQAGGDNAVAMGEETTANANNSTAIGLSTTASEFAATAMGHLTTASGNNATAMGDNTTASGLQSTAMGNETKANRQAATAMGGLTTASGVAATAMSYATTASGFASTAVGFRTTAASPNSLSVGQCTSANTNPDNTLLVVGNGGYTNLSCNSNSDALVLKKNGNLTIAGSVTSESGGFVLPDGTTLDESGDLGGLPTNDNGAFDLSNEDGYVASGTFGSGSIPATGAGTRMMWHPAKAAFRAGRVGGSGWDPSNVGNYSMALGRNVQASGNKAVAMGFKTTADGDQSTAMGDETTASARASTAMGLQTTASGVRSTAMGSHTTASGTVATAMGIRTTANGIASTAMGVETIAASDNSISVGQCTSANTNPDNTLLVVGNGSLSGPSCDNRSDALVLDLNGNLTISGSFTENSDRRLKEQIQPLGEGALGKLGELRPVRFRFKNNRTHPSGPQLGLVAQDVRKEFPALVSEGSGGYLSVSYSKLTAVLLKGLQEQQATIDSLRKRVRQIESLEKRVAQLEAQSTRATAQTASDTPAPNTPNRKE